VIANCQFKALPIVDCQLSIGLVIWRAAAIETLYFAKRQSAIGNWKSAML
jgi:hypothetical protein